VAERSAGKLGKCPKCKHHIRVPNDVAPEAHFCDTCGKTLAGESSINLVSGKIYCGKCYGEMRGTPEAKKTGDSVLDQIGLNIPGLVVLRGKEQREMGRMLKDVSAKKELKTTEHAEAGSPGTVAEAPAPAEEAPPTEEPAPAAQKLAPQPVIEPPAKPPAPPEAPETEEPAAIGDEQLETKAYDELAKVGAPPAIEDEELTEAMMPLEQVEAPPAAEEPQPEAPVEEPAEPPAPEAPPKAEEPKLAKGQRPSDTKLIELLVEAGVVLEGELELALQYQKGLGKRLIPVLDDLKLTSEEEIVETLSKNTGLETCPGEELEIEQDVSQLVDDEAIKRFEVIPLQRQGEALVAAFPNPLHVEGIKELSSIVGLRIIPKVCTWSQYTGARRYLKASAGL